jgi:protein-L-isoaspartate(D-aspartate) O-methyltransferase
MTTNPYPDTFKLRGLRERLVEQLQAKGIENDHLLAAIRRLRRHAFVESAFAEKAYQDIPLPIGQGQTISQPYTVAAMTQLLMPLQGRRVLEIGTGSGYQAAVLAELGANVFSVERMAALHKQAKQLLTELGYRVHLRLGDGTLGWPSYAPFDCIIVTAGGPQVPPALREQLAIGGTLLVPVGGRESQQMQLIRRVGPAQFDTTPLDGYRFVPLIGQAGWGGQ